MDPPARLLPPPPLPQKAVDRGKEINVAAAINKDTITRGLRHATFTRTCAPACLAALHCSSTTAAGMAGAFCCLGLVLGAVGIAHTCQAWAPACAPPPAGTPWPPVTGACRAWGRFGQASRRCVAQLRVRLPAPAGRA